LRRSTYAVGGTVTVAIAISAMMISSATANPIPTPNSQSRAATALNSGSLLAHRNADGRVNALTARTGHPLAVPAGKSGSPESIARTNIDDFASVFGVTKPDSDLALVNSVTAGKGSIVRFQQNHNGLPIIGGQLVVTQDAHGALIAIDGKTSTDLPATTTATVSAAAAASTARNVTATAAKAVASRLTASTPKLSIYDPALFGQPDGLAARPVYQVTVTSHTDPSINEYVLIDARTGNAALAFSQIDTKAIAKAAKQPAVKPAVVAPNTTFTADVSVCDFQDIANTDETCTNPVADPANSAVPDVVDAYDYLGGVNDFYNNVVGRQGIDGANMPVVASVRYCYDNLSGDCPYVNSYWDGSQIVFGDGFPAAADVVAHEYTHGVTQYTSGLLYYYQSGSINESMSDVMGELFDQYNGTDTDGKWIMGEKLAPGLSRNMADPTQSAQGPQPDSMSSPYWSTDGWDDGGVHTDSGIGNKLAYLVAEGTQGTPFNGVTVTGIANDGAADPNMIQKMAKIWVTADQLLTPAADYADLGNAVQTACTTLLASATDGINASDCASVTAAVAATQLESTTSSHLPAQTTVCPTGYTPAVAFSDNFDRTASASLGTNWTDSGPAEIDNYAYSPVVAGNQLYLPDPTNDTAVSNVYVYTKAITLAKTRGSFLYFQHLDSLDWFDGSPDSSIYMEGMYVEYQLGTSTTWTTLGGTWVNGPDKTITHTTFDGSTLYTGTNYAGLAFAGDSRGWASSRAALPTTWEGQSVKFRFRVQTDGYGWFTPSYGEFLDNVSVNTCVKAPLAATTVKVAGYHGSAKMTWGAASVNGGSAITGYEMSVADGAGAYVVKTTTAATTRSYTFASLASGHDYHFRIRAKNADGVYGPYTTLSLSGTSLAIASNVTKVAKGGSVTLTGKLTRTTGGAALTGAPVVVYQRKHGTTTWTATTITAKTSSTGTYSLVVKPTQTEDYIVYYTAGSTVYMGTASATVVITVS
jgi:Zn-dependent metalloprotease